VVCPGVNDGAVLEDTLIGVADRYPDLATVACVPLGVSRFNVEVAMRPHTRAEAGAVIDTVEAWQERFVSAVGRRLVFAADEYYLVAGRPFPSLDSYGDIAQQENGVGMARVFEARFEGRADAPTGGPGGFFGSVDGAPAEGYRAPRQAPGTITLGASPKAPVTVLTGVYGRAILAPLVASVRDDVEILVVENTFFGGNTGVAGLLTGPDLAATLERAPAGRRYLVPDSCLTGGRFLDGSTPGELPRPVEVVPADGASLRAALTLSSSLVGAR
jgi:NifB/MoaA-like Fe-S oxidoreductase